jgi:hypothetical protein
MVLFFSSRLFQLYVEWFDLVVYALSRKSH